MEGVWRPPPAGEAPWNHFFDLLRPSPPFGTTFWAISGRKCPLEGVPTLGADRRDALEAVPRPGAAVVTPWKQFPALPLAVGAPWKHFQPLPPVAQSQKKRPNAPICFFDTMEAVPRLFPGCATPHARSLAVPPPPSARIFAVATNIVIS